MSDPVSNAVHPVERLRALLRDERPELGSLLVYGASVGLVSLTIPVAVAALVNTITFGTVLQPIVVLAVLVLVGLGFEGTLELLHLIVVERIQRRVFVRTSVDLAHRLPRVRPDGFHGHYGPELVNRFFDVATVQKTVATLFLDGLGIILQTVIGLLLLAFYHPILLAFDLVLVLGILVVLFPLGAGAIETSVKESKAKYATAAWLEELARHPAVFRGATAQRFAAARAAQGTETYLRYRAKHFKVLFRQHLGARVFKAVISASLLGIGGWLVINRGLTVGQLVAAELIVTAVVSGLAKFGKQLDAWYDLVTAADKIGHLTDLPLVADGGLAMPERPRLGASLSFESVSATTRAGRACTREVNTWFKPGERVAIFIREERIRETLAALACGDRAPEEGVVRLDGADLRELSQAELRDEVVLLAVPEVFDGTVHENLTLGRGNVSDEVVRGALRSVGLASAVGELAQGSLTMLQSGGEPLTPSQRAALAVARVLVQEPRLVVIDGLLDGLDDDVAATLLSALIDPARPWTILVLTHNESVFARVSTRYRLVDGALSHRAGSGPEVSR
ncbi:MAG: ABC transporter ATP-binding protein [Myxococcales bacterium]|nr:ABC transporter ATP-binding protein [Myxococcales bacterium]